MPEDINENFDEDENLEPMKCDLPGCGEVFYLGQGGAAGADFNFCPDHAEPGISRVG